ncbi:hypothetical protein [Defluviitalea phaphyphila]|uniref:hypothetical protein n=1 Tax=Defluviitalea phaphyphila TaxID=1473580 RepID=UPI000730FACE|nr:hypothetical protein [Defluviitalea phaphyphila]
MNDNIFIKMTKILRGFFIIVLIIGIIISIFLKVQFSIIFTSAIFYIISIALMTLLLKYFEKRNDSENNSIKFNKQKIKGLVNLFMMYVIIFLFLEVIQMSIRSKNFYLFLVFGSIIVFIYFIFRLLMKYIN